MTAAQREIRYQQVAWRVTHLPDGTREITFTDPDGYTVHVLPLPKGMAEAMAAQLRGEQEAGKVVIPREQLDHRRREAFGPEGTILPGDPYPPESFR